MKKFIFLSLCCLFLNRLSSQSTNPAPYCMSGYTSTSSYPEISKVELFTSYIASTVVNVSTHTPAPGYTYYNNITTATLAPLVTHTVRVTLKNVDMETMLNIWIDYNADFSFAANELAVSVPQGSVGTGMAVVKTCTFAIPGSAPWFTPTRMRVSLGWHYANWPTSTFSLNSCHTPTTGDGSAGETEDYDVYISYVESVQELKSELAVPLIPNPAQTFVEISDQLKSKINSYSVIDKLGRTMIQSDKFPIKVEDLPKDLYQIRFRFNSGQILYSKLLVN